MVDIITRAVASSELKEVVNKLIPDSMADDIRKACNLIYPLKEVHIRKVCLRMTLINVFACVFVSSQFLTRIWKLGSNNIFDVKF